MKKITFILTIVQNTLIGRSKQSIGNATFTTWKGKNVLKSKPISVENPQTDGQVTQRLKMTGIVLLFRSVAAAVALGFKERAVGMSEYNAFVKNNIIPATTITLPSTITYNYSAIYMSMGTISPTDMTSVVADDSLNTVVFTFPSTADFPGQSTTDKITIVYINTTGGGYKVVTEGAARSAGTLSVADSAMVTGDVLEVYTFFTKADGSKSSDSTYQQVTVIA